MFPKLIEIGDSFFVPAYGVMVALGFLAALWMASRLGRSVGLDHEKISNLAIYCTLAGFLGAKLMMFAFDWRLYAADPRRIFTFDTLQAAGVFHGGFLLAFLFAWYYIRRHRLPVLLTMDVFAPALGLGHSIGRMGCFLAGCCWGSRCERPWAITFNDPEARELTGVPLGVPLHPVQLYESLGGLALTVFLYWLFRRRPRSGTVIAAYLLLFSGLRFVAEFFREHQQALPLGLPLTNVQWIVVGLMLLGILLLRRSRREAAIPALI